MARKILEASGDKIDCGTSSILNPSAISISAWYYPVTSSPGNYNPIILRRATAGGSPIYDILQHNNTANMAWQVTANVTLTIDPGSATLSLNTWYHTALTYDSSGGLKTYVNATSDGTLAANGTLTSSATQHVCIGFDPDFGGGAGNDVRVADIGMWNTVLTQAEITALSNGARPGHIRQGSLIAWWPLDGIASPEADLSGNANNGTVTGTTLIPGPPIMMFTPRWPLNLEVAVPSILFRKTASRIGTRTGTRQTWAA